MRILVVLAVTGQLTRFFSVAFIVPAIYALCTGLYESMSHFLIALAATLLSGLLSAPFLDRSVRLRRAEALATVSFTWLVIGVCSAIPYILSGMTFVDALFESISGFTTTGSTIMADFSVHDPSIFLWRSMTMWFGGLGIIALFVVVLPGLGIAGRQMFFAESSGAPGETLSPQVRQVSARLWRLYLALTLLLIGLLWLCGMPLYESVCHALTTMPAGGFSPHPLSLAGYDNAAAEVVLTVFMFLAGMSFPLLYVTITRTRTAFLRDGEFLFYFGVFAVLTAGLTAFAWRDVPDFDVPTALRHSAFTIASVMSSTGFGSTDYNLWSDAARALILMGMLVGSCAGSAGGGPKAVRYLLLMKHIVREFVRVLHPRVVASIRFKGQVVGDDTMRAVLSLVALFLMTYVALGLFLVLDGADLVTGFSAAIATVGNIGPGFDVVGPMGGFAGFSDLSKLAMTFGMWIGRLEIVTVLALFQGHVWRNLRWRAFDV
jgi:trk system potassium uptake protein TrkH